MHFELFETFFKWEKSRIPNLEGIDGFQFQVV